VAIDKDKGSQYALKWAADNLLNRGQTVILIHVSLVAGTTSASSSKSACLHLKEQDNACFYVFLTIHFLGYHNHYNYNYNYNYIT
jgi:hypothetical protein